MMARNWLLIGVGGVCLWATGCTSVFHRETPSAIAPEMPSMAAPTADRRAELSTEESVRLCLTTANTLQAGGQLREAILLLERARQKNPRLDLSHRLAVLYNLQGDWSTAEAEFRKALKSKPQDANLLNDIGYAYYNQGMLEEARDFLQQALTRQPDHARAAINLGLVLAQQGRYPESFASFCKALTPGKAASNLAFVMTAQGNLEEAKRYYRQALEQEPGLDNARFALAKLEAGTPYRETTEVPVPEKFRPTPTVRQEPVAQRMRPEAPVVTAAPAGPPIQVVPPTVTAPAPAPVRTVAAAPAPKTETSKVVVVVRRPPTPAAKTTAAPIPAATAPAATPSTRPAATAPTWTPNPTARPSAPTRQQPVFPTNTEVEGSFGYIEFND